MDNTNELGITDAATVLGVEPSHLRWLGDTGVIPMQRTSGKKGPGHRRFKSGDLEDARILRDSGKSWDWIRDYFTERDKPKEAANG